MKRLFIILFAALVCGANGFAQTPKEIKKERQAIQKMAKAELEAKVSKDIRKEAKKLAKEGWKVSPGALPLEKQLERSYTMQYEFDANLLPKYIMGSAQSVGGNMDAARMQAVQLAKQDLASNIQTEVTAIIENTVSNSQMAAEQAESLAKTVSASKALITNSIGRTLTVMEVYRKLDNKNVEVLVRIAYSSEMALNAAKKAVKENLEKEGNELHEKLDDLLGW